VIRVLCVDDHALLREGIAALIARQKDMALVAQASSGSEALQLFRTHEPDVTLMDLQMRDIGGLEAMTAIRSEYPEARIIVLTTYGGDTTALRALKAGARAYLLKSAVHTDLLETIRSVHAGKRALSPDVAGELADHAAGDALTDAEVDVLRLIAAGNANKEIADQLRVTEGAVKGRVKSILSKLVASDRTHAVVIGVQRGIIDI
jgi:DNA-binding NarL/FixJ family response regulator